MGNRERGPLWLERVVRAKQLSPGGRRIYCKCVSWKELGPRTGVGRAGKVAGGHCRFQRRAHWKLTYAFLFSCQRGLGYPA